MKVVLTFLALLFGVQETVSGQTHSEPADAVLDALFNSSMFSYEGTFAVDPRALDVEWRELGGRIYPKYYGSRIRTDDTGVVRSGSSVAGLQGARRMPAEAVRGCWEARTCDLDYLIQFSEPKVEGDSAWILVSVRTVVHTGDHVSFSGSEAIASLARSSTGWEVARYATQRNID